jgi:cytosine deaminase
MPPHPVGRRYGPQDVGVCFEMMTERAAQVMRLSDYGIAVGNAADLVVWDEVSSSDIIATCALPLTGFKRGRQIFSRALPTLHRP